MAIITENLILDYIKNLSFAQIKHIIHRQRIKIDKPTIAFYLYCLYLHQHKQKNFTYIHNHYFLDRYNTKYSTFMHNIHFLSPLIFHFFTYINKKFYIDISNTIIVDTTLIEEKKRRIY